MTQLKFAISAITALLGVGTAVNSNAQKAPLKKTLFLHWYEPGSYVTAYWGYDVNADQLCPIKTGFVCLRGYFFSKIIDPSQSTVETITGVYWP